MRVSFDLDDTLICHGSEATRCEPRLCWFLRRIVGDEPLRRGARELFRTLERGGHELWIYTSSGRRAWAVRWWLRAYGIRVARVINGGEHARHFGAGSSPSKRPHCFGIDLHVDDAPGVAIEGERHGFAVCLVEPLDERWASRVLAAVAANEATRGSSRASR